MMFISASRRLACALVVGLATALVTGWLSKPGLGALVGVAVTGAVFIVVGWMALWPFDVDATRHTVRRENFRPMVDEIVVVVAALSGIGAVGTLVALGGTKAGPLPAAIALLAVFTSWGALHLMYATRYAAEYYSDAAGPKGGGIDFNSDDLPQYRDFFYFSYNLGMTYQVSDTSVTSTGIRAVVLRHCLMSYLFGAVILATTVNLVGGIVTG